jgi:hypothetical protein
VVALARIVVVVGCHELWKQLHRCGISVPPAAVTPSFGLHKPRLHLVGELGSKIYEKGIHKTATCYMVRREKVRLTSESLYHGLCFVIVQGITRRLR